MAPRGIYRERNGWNNHDCVRVKYDERQELAVDLYLDQQAIDTTTPAGRLMFQVTGAFAEFERSMWSSSGSMRG
jgi:DNA invertase Pin-like site-specific DNA recombinase